MRTEDRGHQPRAAAIVGGMLFALLALAAVLGATANQSAAAPTAKAVADATAIACGRSVVVGFSAPITGQVAAAGAQMVKWGSIRPDALEQGESAEPDPARHGRHAAARHRAGSPGGRGLRVQPVDARCRRAGRKPGDRGLDGTVSQGRAGEHLGHGHADRPHDLRHAARVLLPHRPERRATGVEGGRVHARHPAGEQSRRHRCAEQLQRRSVRRRRASAGRRGGHRAARVRERGDGHRLLVADRADSEQHAGRLRPVADSCEGPALRPAAAGLRQERHSLRADGLYAPGRLQDPGLVCDRVPGRQRIIQSSGPTRAGPGGGRTDLFGLPSYVAVDVAARAVQKACANRQATRAEVRRFVNQTNIPAPQSLLGFRVRFQQTRQGSSGPET